MNRSELESKHLAELHELAAEAGIERFRMLPRAELVERLADGSDAAPSAGAEASAGTAAVDAAERVERSERARAAEPPTEATPEKPRRSRRRRRFRRRGGRTVRVHEMLTPGGGSARQALVYAETRETCTALLREVAAELSGGRGPDPVALLVDPSPEELADWKREAPKAEIVSAGQERHAEDALAQAVRRAEGGEEVVLLIDSLTRIAEEFGGSRTAKELFDSGASAGSLTIVAAVQRPG
jgi:transcription termination factor Rho